jgi:hypothetical protein
MKTLVDHFKDYFTQVDMPVSFDEFSNGEYDHYVLFNHLCQVKKCGNLLITWEVHENYVNITIDDFFDFPYENKLDYLELCNEINEKCRYATFYADENSIKLKHTVFLLDYNNMENTAQHVIDYVTNNLVILAERTIDNFRGLLE